MSSVLPLGYFTWSVAKDSATSLCRYVAGAAPDRLYSLNLPWALGPCPDKHMGRLPLSLIRFKSG